MQQQTKSIQEWVGKTIQEWFEFANANNYSWADAALANALNPRCNHNCDITHRTKTLSGALFVGFDWERSWEGKYYWQCIYDYMIVNGI